MSDSHRRGLQVYVNTVGADSSTPHGVFYSRRADGPFYRWHYEAENDRWCSSRAHLVAKPRSFRMAQKRVPSALRTRLLEHYED
ncbi:MAG: hypothetical protein M3R15_27005 [Acidobacteriota bacterium]|nr:hypothetical protein [Acidobacteriota bacterium]